MQLEKIFKESILSMNAYHVSSRSGLTKLDSMEMPYLFPEELNAALFQALQLVSINRYPNSRALDLTSRIKKQFNLPENREVLLGNGSDELIQILMMAASRPNTKIMSPVPSFVMYQQMANILGMEFLGIDLNNDFSIDESLFLSKVQEHQPSIIFLAYPNNPTGTVLPQAFIEQVIKVSEGLVILDEAYESYTQYSTNELLKSYDNVVVMRTLSKIGLAGVRLGYLVASNSVITELNKVRMPYNINVLTQTVANFILDHFSFVNQHISQVQKTKKDLFDWLSQQQNITVYPSEANFLLVRVKDADQVFEQLKSQYKILVKNLNGVHPILDNVLRITVGTEKEIEILKVAMVQCIE